MSEVFGIYIHIHMPKTSDMGKGDHYYLFVKEFFFVISYVEPIEPIPW